MRLPGEEQWLRVEALAQELTSLSPDNAALRISELAAAGESATVLTILGTWLSLASPPAPIGAGSVIGERYALIEKLGQGGMGSVWKARHHSIGRDVALKMIHPALVTPSLRERFVREINFLAQLKSDGIVTIHDAGVHEASEGLSVPFFVMELIEGLPLDKWAAGRRPDISLLLRTVA